jgi:hypothetical protein
MLLNLSWTDNYINLYKRTFCASLTKWHLHLLKGHLLSNFWLICDLENLVELAVMFFYSFNPRRNLSWPLCGVFSGLPLDYHYHLLTFLFSVVMSEVLYSRVVRIDASVLSVQSYYIPGLSVSLRVSWQYSRTIFQGCQYVASVLTVQRYCIPWLSLSLRVFCQYSRTIFQGCQYVASVLTVQRYCIPRLSVSLRVL